MTMTEKTGCGIVTYNPDINRLKENIEAISSQISNVVIFDNGSQNVTEIDSLSQKYQIKKVIHSKENVGIAKALNQILSEYVEIGYEWVVTLDQDSVSPNNLVEELSKYKNDDVGAIGPSIYDINKKQNIGNVVGKYTECDHIITSGCLTSVKAWKAIDGFDELMFIDGVDFDFCNRLRKAGYKVLQVHSVSLTHEIGHIENHKFLFWNIAVKNHSAFRKYYIAKNIFYLDWKEKKRFFPVSALLRVAKQLLLVILYEEDKNNKIKAIIQGSKDAFSIFRGDNR